MRKLSNVEIEKLASRKGAKRIAIENFLSSLEGLNEFEAFGNLYSDAKSYHWNRKTVDQISAGIRKVFQD